MQCRTDDDVVIARRAGAVRCDASLTPTQAPTLPLDTLKLIFSKTLNSVAFGVSLMVLIALYIALGSGFRRCAAWLEMSDLEFFNAWPLKVLMILLVVTLATVTWTRIPFTPPRYGVWMIHCGIIVLIVGMCGRITPARSKGTIRIPVGQTVDHFYDGAERSLYAKIERPTLASSHAAAVAAAVSTAYDAELEERRLPRRADLRDIRPTGRREGRRRDHDRTSR